MKNFWRVMVVVVSLLATYVGAMYATTEKSKGEIAQANIAPVKAEKSMGSDSIERIQMDHLVHLDYFISIELRCTLSKVV